MGRRVETGELSPERQGSIRRMVAYGAWAHRSGQCPSGFQFWCFNDEEETLVRDTMGERHPGVPFSVSRIGLRSSPAPVTQKDKAE